jgi:multicomponent Na+:H+ antiporter subunit E
MTRIAPTLRELASPRRLLSLALLTLAWCALWGAVSAANVLAGLVVGTVVLVASGVQPGLGRIRILPLLQFVWLVAVDLVGSTIAVAWEVITPADDTDEAIIAVDTDLESRSHFLLLVVAITVTPGTAVVDTDGDTGRLYLHLLHAEKAEGITTHVQRIAELACRALPVRAPQVDLTAATRPSAPHEASS